jgi:hypothetical protein
MLKLEEEPLVSRLAGCGTSRRRRSSPSLARLMHPHGRWRRSKQKQYDEALAAYHVLAPLIFFDHP